MISTKTRLPGEQYGELKQALLDAYSREELREMLRIQLSRDFDIIVGEGSLDIQVSSLISWFERRGLIADLIKGARRANPTNPTLCEFVQKYPDLITDPMVEGTSDKGDKQTSIKIVIEGNELSDQQRAFLERVLCVTISVAYGVIRITHARPFNSVQLTIELPQSEVLNLYAAARNSGLENVEVKSISLSGVNLAGADLAAAILNEADLSGANLVGADLTGADLTSADLTGANLTGADLTGADLTGADLTGADLTGADLTGADLTGADLTGADLTGTRLNEKKDFAIDLLPTATPLGRDSVEVSQTEESTDYFVLRLCAERVQRSGRTLTVEELRNWLQLASWEGEAFTDVALAYAVGYTDETLEEFQAILDDFLAVNDEVQGVVEELDDVVAIHTHDLSKPIRYLAKYRLVPHGLAKWLFEQQDRTQYLRNGKTYAEALVRAYVPEIDRVLPRLLHIYSAIGDPQSASDLRKKYEDTGHGDYSAIDEVIYSMASDIDSKRILLDRTLRSIKNLFVQATPIQSTLNLKRALELAMELDDKRAQAEVRMAFGTIYLQTRDYAHASSQFTQALQLFQETQDRAGIASARSGLGGLNAVTGELHVASQHFLEALSLVRQTGDRNGETANLINLGVIYSSEGDPQTALSYFEFALKLLSTDTDLRHKAAAFSNIAATYARRDDLQAALALYNQALELFREIEDKGGETAALANIGVTYAMLGDLQLALTYCEQALPLFRQAEDKCGEAATLANIAGLSHARGDTQQALTYYEQALPLFHQAEDRSGEAATLANIAGLSHARGDTQQALTCYERALPLFKLTEDKGSEAATLANIAMVYDVQGDSRQALTYYEQALPLLGLTEGKDADIGLTARMPAATNQSNFPVIGPSNESESLSAAPEDAGKAEEASRNLARTLESGKEGEDYPDSLPLETLAANAKSTFYFFNTFFQVLVLALSIAKPQQKPYIFKGSFTG